MGTTPGTASQPPAPPPSEDIVKITTWNVQNASPQRSAAQASWLAGTDAQVLVLTEVSPTHDTLAQQLSAHGFSTYTPVPTYPHIGDYRVVLACRGADLVATPEALPDYMPHRCALATIRLSTSRAAEASRGPTRRTELVVAGLYVPSRGPQSRRNVDKRAFQSAVATWLPALVGAAQVGTTVVIAGDLNVVEPGHVPHHVVFGAWEYDFYRSFAAAGFADAYRDLHPVTVAHSWFGRRSNAGYRFDHLFTGIDQRQHLLACEYDHSPRTGGLSDHAALSAHLLLSTPGTHTT
ncbi:MAG: endonuclease [Actinomycetales bacterium]|nr:endonuclease [Actinomycetales bacterium]